jgi:ornithine decarboxylase
MISNDQFQTNTIMENLIDLTLHNKLSSLNRSGQSITNEEPFFVADLGQVVRQHRRWKSALPHVHPFHGKRLFHTASGVPL